MAHAGRPGDAPPRWDELWSVGLVGPLLYDVASAVMYVGGPDRGRALVEAYLGSDVLGKAEVERGLGVMLRFRWAVQADYFARRIVEDDRTGIDGPADNERNPNAPAEAQAVAEALVAAACPPAAG